MGVRFERCSPSEGFSVSICEHRGKTMGGSRSTSCKVDLRCPVICVYMSQVPGTPQPAQWYGAPPPKPPICTLFKHSLPVIHYLQHFRATTSWVTGPCPAVYFQHINLDLAITGILPKTCLCTAYSMPYTWLYSQRAHIDTYVILLSIGLDAVCTYKSPPKMTYPCVVYTLPHHYLYTP